MMTPNTIVSAVMMMNGAARLKASMVSAEITGPIANPATSMETPRPKLRPMFSGSLTITMRLIAGIAIPAPRPMTNRPRRNAGSDSPKAIMTAPTALASMPRLRSFRACPLSASGAMVSCATNDVKKPIAMIMLRPVS